jgi:hypothetical protein
MLLLKDVEELMESYYNSGYFKFTIEYLFWVYKKPSILFMELAKYWDLKKVNHVSHKSDALFSIIYEFAKYSNVCDMDLLGELIQFDYFRIGKRKDLSWYNSLDAKMIREKSHTFLQKDSNVEKYLPNLLGIAAKNIIKKVHFANFKYDIKTLNYENYKKEEVIYLFDYDTLNNIFDYSNYYNVTDEFYYEGES